MRKNVTVTIAATIGLAIVGGAIWLQGERRPIEATKNLRYDPQRQQLLAEFTDLLRAGGQSLEANAPTIALAKSNEALTLRPRNPEGLLLRARANLALNNDTEALTDLFDVVTGNASLRSTLETDPALIAETVLLAERLNDVEKLSVLMAKAESVVSSERTNDGLPVPSAELSDKDRLLAVAAKRSFMRGEASDAIAYLVQVSDQDNEVIRYYRASAEQNSGNYAYAQALYKALASDPNVSPEIRTKSKARSGG